MLSRIILILFVLLVMYFRKGIVTAIGVVGVSAVIGLLAGLFFNWIVNGNLLSREGCEAWALSGIIAAGVIIVLRWLASFLL